MNENSERDVLLPDPGVRKNLVKEHEVVCPEEFEKKYWLSIAPFLAEQYLIMPYLLEVFYDQVFQEMAYIWSNFDSVVFGKKLSTQYANTSV